jgi:hypothetical protein
MRYSSVEWTPVVPRKFRRRLGLMVWHKCRRPALGRSTLPVAVILNRLAADFLVLMPFGRRIIQSVFHQKRARNIGRSPRGSKRYFEPILNAERRLNAGADLTTVNRDLKPVRHVPPHPTLSPRRG